MLECLIVGDSIAVGVAQARPECVAYAKVGINSHQWLKQYAYKLQPAKTTIISLGANDAKVNTLQNLKKLRAKIQSGRVVWLLPNQKRKPQEVILVQQVADEYGDLVLPRPTTNISGDGIHPTAKGYKLLAEQTK